MIALRHAYPALRTGQYQVLFAEGTAYVFARILGTEEIIVAVNVGTESVSITIEVDSLESKPSQLLYGHTEVSWTEQKTNLALNIPPRSGCILG